MNIIIPISVTHEIIYKCVTSISSTIVSSYNFYNFIITNSPNDYQNYQNEIISTDLANKLLIASSLIKDIIKKHHYNSVSDKSISIEKIIESYKEQIKIEYLQNEEFNIITHIQNNNIIADVPEPVKIALNSTIEIIDKINNILEKIHCKLSVHSKSYIKYLSKLNIKNEVLNLITLDKLFDKRLTLLIDIIKIYDGVVK